MLDRCSAELCGRQGLDQPLDRLIKNEGLSSFLHGPQIARDRSAIDLGSAQAREISGALDGEAERIGLVSVDMAHVARFPVRHPGIIIARRGRGYEINFWLLAKLFSKGEKRATLIPSAP